MPAIVPFVFRPLFEKLRMLGKSVFFRNFSNRSARVSEGRRPCRNTSRNDGSRADHTPFLDRYTGQNGVALYFGFSRFTATERSHSRHPEPTPLPALRRI